MRKWEEDSGVDMSSERTRTPRKSECVGACVCLYLCKREGRAGVPFGGTSQDCQKESTASRLLM